MGALDIMQKTRTWAEISLTALDNNYKAFRGMIHDNCRMMVAVKANAYGHGAVEISRRLEKLGVDMLGVACLNEAMELREAGISTPILCLGHTAPEMADYLIDNDITQTIFDYDTASAFSEAAVKKGKKLTVHIKLDTGMTRIGFQWTEAAKAASAEEIARIFALPGLNIEGMFSHFAASDEDPEYTKMQIERVIDARKTLEQRGLNFEICHCAASQGTIRYPEAHFDMIRPGTGMYGYCSTGVQEGMMPVMKLKTRIVAVRKVEKGSRVSYGGTATLDRDSLLAVLPIGYADGFARGLSNTAEVMVNGHRCKIVGRICMDMCMIDITDTPEVKCGDEVVVFGEETLMAEQTAQIDSIPIEVLSRVNVRVPRIYVED